ncbi:MAG: hypothetical protein WAM60_20965, partial [Candidatus Promineifilaceae bacterium]
NYDKWAAYSQSKVANLLFAYELQRRLEAINAKTISVGAHPGYAATNLQQAGPKMEGARLQSLIMGILNRIVAQDAASGVRPQLYAATAPAVNGCDYIGPGGFRESRGYPKKIKSSDLSYDRQTAARLWQVSEDLTGVHFLSGE